MLLTSVYLSIYKCQGVRRWRRSRDREKSTLAEQTSDFLSLRLSRASAGSISILNIIINRSLIRLKLACDCCPDRSLLDNAIRERWLESANEKSAMRTLSQAFPSDVMGITAQFTIVAIEPALARWSRLGESRSH